MPPKSYVDTSNKLVSFANAMISKSSRPLEGGNTRQIRSNVKGKKGRRGTVENGHTKNKPHSHFLALAPGMTKSAHDLIDGSDESA